MPAGLRLGLFATAGALVAERVPNLSALDLVDCFNCSPPADRFRVFCCIVAASPHDPALCSALTSALDTHGFSVWADQWKELDPLVSGIHARAALLLDIADVYLSLSRYSHLPACLLTHSQKALMPCLTIGLPFSASPGCLHQRIKHSQTP